MLAVFECNDFGLTVGNKLLVNILRLTGLDVELTLKDFSGAEYSYAGLVTLDGCKLISTGSLEELLCAQSVLLVGCDCCTHSVVLFVSTCREHYGSQGNDKQFFHIYV